MSEKNLQIYCIFVFYFKIILFNKDIKSILGLPTLYTYMLIVLETIIKIIHYLGHPCCFHNVTEFWLLNVFLLYPLEMRTPGLVFLENWNKGCGQIFFQFQMCWFVEISVLSCPPPRSYWLLCCSGRAVCMNVPHVAPGKIRLTVSDHTIILLEVALQILPEGTWRNFIQAFTSVYMSSVNSYSV